MRRSAFVFAPVLAATAASVMLGCHEVKVPQESATAASEAAVETRRGGFGASFENHPVIWWFAAAGAIVIAGRFVSPGE